MRRVTGPPEVFEGPKGFFEATGTKADIDWSDDRYESPTRVSLKPHNAEVHTQSTITGMPSGRLVPGHAGQRAEPVDDVRRRGAGIMAAGRARRTR